MTSDIECIFRMSYSVGDWESIELWARKHLATLDLANRCRERVHSLKSGESLLLMCGMYPEMDSPNS